MPKSKLEELIEVALNNSSKAATESAWLTLAGVLSPADSKSGEGVATSPSQQPVGLQASSVSLVQPPSRGYADAGQVSASVDLLRRASTVLTQTETSSAKTTAGTSEASDGNGVTSTILKTVGMATGLGPLISGIMGLFGSGDPEPTPLPTSYIAPERLSVEAGLAADRSFTQVSYAQNGLSRSDTAATSSVNQTQPRVEIHVQAMDSRSFLDHSDDIARAVQSAMLQSHSLNDVVAEL